MTRAGCTQDLFGLLVAARSAVAKVVQALPAEKRSRITSSGELLADDGAILEFPPERQPIYETILGALAQRKRLRLWYRERETGPVATTSLSLYRLARIQAQWSLVGHSSSHGAVRIYGVPWIQRLELTDEPYSIPPRFRLDRFLRKSAGIQPGPLGDVQLRFAPAVAPVVRDTARQRDQTVRTVPGGGLDLFFKVKTLDEILAWVIGFGDQVEVLEPEHVRTDVRKWAERIVQIHSRAVD